MALLVGVAEQFTDVFRLERVQDVEEVISWRAFALRIRISKVLREVLIFGELRPQGLDGKLVILRDFDLSYV